MHAMGQRVGFMPHGLMFCTRVYFESHALRHIYTPRVSKSSWAHVASCRCDARRREDWLQQHDDQRGEQQEEQQPDQDAQWQEEVRDEDSWGSWDRRASKRSWSSWSWEEASTDKTQQETEQQEQAENPKTADEQLTQARRAK